MLSGGATFGKFHFGFLKAIYEQDLMPRIVCGSSVGAIVVSAVCSRSYEDLHEYFSFESSNPLPNLKITSDGFIDTLYRILF